ncbi:uroporphyrin-3 C-methyltransferase/uroporphyrinogen III methyltransferase/synthase [Paucimonas lemoignei]|uniref:Uroporphyrin-3 C-methyltransferase/uroporphyrinogen III methyltransferase/synthase n=1 Tax=Paucimonas lemoignei TaxID=29443 RepID=A0A4R3HQC0_PAULE|nr:uroporphyrinogen-III C-methyltransferase [Paucimonas lemoignei]TCS34031.1 uroporphyrin-3 C-methyltransferase/uroporphyrinogen III methyltransferase/synthase [Paucimonas lemoignei]
MNELPSSHSESMPRPESTTGAAAAPAGAVPSAGAPAASRTGMQRLLPLALLILAVLLAAQWWTTRKELHSLRSTLAQRLQSGEALNTETRLLAKAAQETSKELQAKVNVLENKQTEAQSQQVALEQLYQELAHNRDEWALSEIEQVLSTASQQLQLAGNVPGALIALQNADRLLSRSDKAQFITIRRAIARDQEKLKSLPIVDVTGMALRLDSVIGQVDALPLLSDEKPAVPATQPKNARVKQSKSVAAFGLAAPADTSNDWMTVARNKWDSWSNEIWVELKQLVRVREVATPDALLLSPTQAFYARENLKLRLLSARLALLSRNESAFRNDILAAQDTIVRYFDTGAKQTQTAQALLKQIQNSNLSIEMPTLADSLNAVRNYKATP